MRSTTTTLIQAMRVLARDVQSEDGIANSAIAEAADRLEELKGIAEVVLIQWDERKLQAKKMEMLREAAK